MDRRTGLTNEVVKIAIACVVTALMSTITTVTAVNVSIGYIQRDISRVESKLINIDERVRKIEIHQAKLSD